MGYFEEDGLDYRFVVMARHPCLYGSAAEDAHGDGWERFPEFVGYLNETLQNVLEEKRFTLAYVDLGVH